MASTQKDLTDNPFDLPLKTKWLGQTIDHYSVLASTQSQALKHAQAGCEEGLVIISDKQTAGKGSQARTWYSNNEKGMWMSFVLRPNLTQRKSSQLTLLTATVLIDVIEDMTELKAAIKWPNDILIGDKKVAGILTESKSKGEKIAYAVVGIGLNVNQRKHELNNQIVKKATSLNIETDQSYSKNRMIQEFLNQFEFNYNQYQKKGFHYIKEKWLASAYRLGDQIKYKVNEIEKEGTFLTIDDDGGLIVENQQHTKEKLFSAEISWF